MLGAARALEHGKHIAASVEGTYSVLCWYEQAPDGVGAKVPNPFFAPLSISCVLIRRGGREATND